MLAARTLRAKADTSDTATTDELVRPLVTEHIEHLARHRRRPWIAHEFAGPIDQLTAAGHPEEPQ